MKYRPIEQFTTKVGKVTRPINRRIYLSVSGQRNLAFISWLASAFMTQEEKVPPHMADQPEEERTEEMEIDMEKEESDGKEEHVMASSSNAFPDSLDTIEHRLADDKPSSLHQVDEDVPP